jgi:hypothetical protein
MAFPPEKLDTIIIGIWCFLTGDPGKPLMGLIGIGGLIFTIRSLAKLPEIPKTEIITRRNICRRFRSRTKVIGYFAALSFLLSIVAYVVAIPVLQGVQQLCKLAPPPHSAAIAAMPFLALNTFGLIMYLWFQKRVIDFGKL